MSTLVNTYYNEDVQDGDVLATYTTMDMIAFADLLEDYNGALQLVQTSPMTIELIAVDVSGLPSTFVPEIYAENAFGGEIVVEDIAFSPSANNLPPETVDDHVGVEFGGEVTFDPAANDTDPNDDTVTVTSVQLSDPTQGEIVLNTDGTVTFTSSDYIGDVTAEYTVDDGRGGTSTGTITITVSDTVAPTQTTTITDIIDDAEFNTGVIADGGVTNDTTPKLQ
ncbi:MAG: cadherin-like domain-containing protein [Sulfurovaceae bacterium]